MVVSNPTMWSFSVGTNGPGDAFEPVRKDVEIVAHRQPAVIEIEVDVQTVTKLRQAGVVRPRGIRRVEHEDAEKQIAAQVEMAERAWSTVAGGALALLVERTRLGGDQEAGQSQAQNVCRPAHVALIADLRRS